MEIKTEKKKELETDLGVKTKICEHPMLKIDFLKN